jgi:hypothetical protein
VSIATDSLDAIFNVDETSLVKSGSIVGRGYLDQPTSVLAGGEVLAVDYVLHTKNDFSSLKFGDTLTVQDSNRKDVSYTVRTNEADIDGLTRQISLSKV